MRLVESALKLSHRRSLSSTSLADIAKDARIPLGNVYYYFKSKDDIAEAMIEDRSAEFRAAEEQMNAIASPRDRLIAFVQMSSEQAPMVTQCGCPMGTLSLEIQKTGGALGKKATALLGEPLRWMERQFKELDKGPESRSLAVHLYSALQGIAVLANGLQDASIVALEAERLTKWLRSL